MLTLNTIYQTIKKTLQKADINNPQLVARTFIKEATGLSDADFIAEPDHPVTPEQQAQIESFVARRLAGEPVSRILGEREFWGLSFKVTPDVLDPRPDTETLVEAALDRFKDNPPTRILDLGTGSGCILIALLHEWSDAQGVAVDISDKALTVARENAERNGVADRITFIQSNWGDSVSGTFDLIVSNPPYIANHEIPNLAVEVRNHDPILALVAEEEGLRAYRDILSQIKNLLKPGGRVFFEVGHTQAGQVARLSEDVGATLSRIVPDLVGIPRVVEISYGDK